MWTEAFSHLWKSHWLSRENLRVSPQIVDFPPKNRQYSCLLYSWEWAISAVLAGHVSLEPLIASRGNQSFIPHSQNNLNSLNDLQNLFFNGEYVHFEHGEKRFKQCTVKRRSKDVSHLLDSFCFTSKKKNFKACYQSNAVTMVAATGL